MGRLVEIHEVHVDLGPGKVAVVLGMQVEQRLLKSDKARDPHPGRREGVHPGDHADAIRGGRRLEEERPDRLQGRDDWTGHDPDRDGLGVVEGSGDLGRVLGHFAQRVLAVQRLAAGDEPDFAPRQDVHATPSPPRRSSPTCRPRYSPAGLTLSSWPAGLGSTRGACNRVYALVCTAVKTQSRSDLARHSVSLEGQLVVERCGDGYRPLRSVTYTSSMSPHVQKESGAGDGIRTRDILLGESSTREHSSVSVEGRANRR